MSDDGDVGPIPHLVVDCITGRVTQHATAEEAAQHDAHLVATAQERTATMQMGVVALRQALPGSGDLEALVARLQQDPQVMAMVSAMGQPGDDAEKLRALLQAIAGGQNQP